jgi:hypothetical protein
MIERRSMQWGNWFNAAANAVIGCLLGMAADGLAQLVVAGWWPVALLIAMIFPAVLLFDRLLDGIFERVFPGGIRPARTPKAKAHAPLVRVLSLPAGFALGLILTRLGLAEQILGAL